MLIVVPILNIFARVSPSSKKNVRNHLPSQLLLATGTASTSHGDRFSDQKTSRVTVKVFLVHPQQMVVICRRSCVTDEAAFGLRTRRDSAHQGRPCLDAADRG